VLGLGLGLGVRVRVRVRLGLGSLSSRDAGPSSGLVGATPARQRQPSRRRNGRGSARADALSCRGRSSVGARRSPVGRVGTGRRRLRGRSRCAGFRAADRKPRPVSGGVWKQCRGGMMRVGKRGLAGGGRVGTIGSVPSTRSRGESPLACPPSTPSCAAPAGRRVGPCPMGGRILRRRARRRAAGR